DPKPDPFRFHHADPPPDHRFFQFKIRNAISQQPTGFIVAFEDRHSMTGLVQLCCRGQSGRTTAHDSHFPSGPDYRWNWPYVSPFESFFRNTFLDVFDGHRRLVDTEDTCRLARCRADPSGKFGKIVGAGKDFISFLPVSPVHRIVEIRDYIAQGATIVA